MSRLKHTLTATFAILCAAPLAAQKDCDRVDDIIDRAYALESTDLDSALFLSSDLVTWVVACSQAQQVAAFIRHSSLLGERGEFEEALSFAIRAHQLAKSLNDKSIEVKAAGILASSYSLTGNVDLAEVYFKEALNKAEGSEDNHSLVSIMINYGLLLFEDKNDTVVAIAMLEKAERWAEDYDLRDDLYTVRQNVASIYARMGQMEDSKRMFFRLLNDPEFSKNEVAHFYVVINLGYLYDELNVPDSSAYYFRMAYKAMGSSSGIQEKATSIFGMAYMFEHSGVYDSALHYYQLGSNVSDSALNLERMQMITGLRERYEADLRENEIRELVQINRISDLQRNFFIVLAFLMIAVATAIGVVLSHRRHLDRLRSEQRIAELEKEKEVLSLQSMLVAQEEERQRIARDLHDSIGALLSAARLHISNIEEEIKKLTNLDFLGATSEAIDRASKEVRRVAHDMMPGVLMKLGLLEGIEDFFERMRTSTQMNLSLTYDDFPFRLENKAEVMIYRMVQELVQNTLKHAEATEIKLMIKWHNNEVVVDYRDDGKGFEASALYDQQNFGLTGLKSRVNFLKGRLDLKTAPGYGVHYTIYLPAQPASD